MIEDQCSKENKFRAHFQDLEVQPFLLWHFISSCIFSRRPCMFYCLIKASVKVLSLSIKNRICKTLVSGAAEAKWSSFKICSTKTSIEVDT